MDPTPPLVAFEQDAFRRGDGLLVKLSEKLSGSLEKGGNSREVVGHGFETSRVVGTAAQRSAIV
jgi:hypothetical protein